VIESIGEDANKAFQAFKIELVKKTIPLKLLPSQMAIIDNQCMAHGRTSFTANYDGYDRWIERVYILNNLPDLWQNEVLPFDSRVLECSR
jgi:L-asparagine oxygenase